MDQPLVDREGFPRNDIDVVAVRTARHTIIGKCVPTHDTYSRRVYIFNYTEFEPAMAPIELTNDHKQLMKEIEQAILGLHQDNKSNPRTSNATAAAQPITSQDQPSEPFARVNAVAPDSPAKEAVSDIMCI
jgi:26S proteasome regulatory subunit N4